jgi:SAM-dependent methyltransferase
LYISDGVSIPVAPESITFAFSNQLMEHLHPEDAVAQLRNVHKALAPGGKYFCITPSALSGPHDISRYFDDVATGFHLKEYTYHELRRLFDDVGFTKTQAMLSMRGRSVLVPVGICEFVESLVRALPSRWRRVVAGRLPLRLLLGVQILGTKI